MTLLKFLFIALVIGQSIALSHIEREMLDEKESSRELASKVLHLPTQSITPDWSWPWQWKFGSSPTPSPITKNAPSCSTPSGNGKCIKVASCATMGGTSKAGYCAGDSSIRCCLPAPQSTQQYIGKSCTTPYGSGSCQYITSECSSKSSIAGYCRGPSNIQCCVTKRAAGGATISTSGGSGQYGIDLYPIASVQNWQCFTDSVSFAIIRAFRSSGKGDSAVCPNIKNAVMGGFSPSNLDVYMFPCPTCAATASQQFASMMSGLTACSSGWSQRVWLDIEGEQYWFGDYTKNWNWYKSLVDACLAYPGVSCAVYSNAAQWGSLFGSTSKVYSKSANLPLWYPRYPNNKSPSLSDYTPFGGWSTPVMKQYVGDASLCTMEVDLNYSPSFY